MTRTLSTSPSHVMVDGRRHTRSYFRHVVLTSRNFSRLESTKEKLHSSFLPSHLLLHVPFFLSFFTSPLYSYSPFFNIPLFLSHVPDTCALSLTHANCIYISLDSTPYFHSIRPYIYFSIFPPN